MAQGAIVLRSLLPAARIRLFSANGTRLLEAQPEFRWQELQAGVPYQFGITDDTGRSLYETQVDTASLTLPATVQLRDGGSYTWVVSAKLPDGRKYVSTGVFSVASADLLAQAMDLRTDASAPVSSRVAYAAWLEQAELKDEARKHWRALAAERPQDMRLQELATQ